MAIKNKALPIQKFVASYAQSDVPYPVVNALVDSARRNNFIQESDIQQAPGKKRTLRLDYIAPDCDDTGSCGADLCAPGRPTDPKQEFFELSMCTPSPVYEMAVDDIREIDNIDVNEFALAQLAANMSTVRKKLAVAMLSKLAGRMGRFADGSTTKRLQLVNSSDGTLKPYQLNEFNRTFQDLNMSNPFILGGASVYHLQAGLKIATTNNAGQQLNQLAVPNAYYDKIVNDYFGGGEHILSWDPRYLKFLTFSRNAGRFATNYKNYRLGDAYQEGIDYIHTVIIDPVTQIMWDFNAIYDKCVRKWRFQYQLEWDIFFLPATSCLPNWVNGILHWVGCDPVELPCPTGTVVTPPSTAVFSWAPGTFPKAINRLELAGHVFNPNTNVANIAELATLMSGLGIGTFTVSGSNIVYTGYSAITGEINDTTAITFA